MREDSHINARAAAVAGSSVAARTDGDPPSRARPWPSGPSSHIRHRAHPASRAFALAVAGEPAPEIAIRAPARARRGRVQAPNQSRKLVLSITFAAEHGTPLAHRRARCILSPILQVSGMGPARPVAGPTGPLKSRERRVVTRTVTVYNVPHCAPRLAWIRSQPGTCAL